MYVASAEPAVHVSTGHATQSRGGEQRHPSWLHRVPAVPGRGRLGRRRSRVRTTSGTASPCPSGIGKVGEKAATAIADFIVVDMFANYCTGSKDAKTAMAEAERQLKRIYR